MFNSQVYLDVVGDVRERADIEVNNNGPNMLSCGTPVSRRWLTDETPRSETNCYSSSRYDCIHLKSESHVPYRCDPRVFRS